MPRRETVKIKSAILGIECGGTRTVALLAHGTGPALKREEFGPANLRLLDDAKLARHFRKIKAAFPAPDLLGIGMAGARTESDRARIRKASALVWKGVPCLATNDLETALAAGRAKRPSANAILPAARILILSGTGSCCYGRNSAGKTKKLGGWGHLLGDKGSGFEIGMRALKAIVYYLDLDGRWTTLGKRVLRALNLNEPNELIDWVRDAPKDDIAALAPDVFAAAAKRDSIAIDILTGASSSLARDAVHCAKPLAETGELVEFVFAGSILVKQRGFAKQVETKIRERWPSAVCAALKRESVWGAVELARSNAPAGGDVSKAVFDGVVDRDESGKPWATRLLSATLTEQRNPRSMGLDKMTIGAAIDLMLSEDEKLPEAIRQERDAIAWVVRRIAEAFAVGGRLFYVGAGTSGRLGVLDASECPPTFRADPEMVQGIIAGGARAIANPVEGAEDDPDAGARAIRFRDVTKKDVVVGIAASGRTPFVWGALWEAKAIGAKTALVCFNPDLKMARKDRPDRIIAPDIGPEILTGSTRLKSGTATKLILNMFTTLAMVRIGKVVSNLMVDVKPSNVKLRDRAERIVREITGGDVEAAQMALKKTNWNVKRACELLMACGKK